MKTLYIVYSGTCDRGFTDTEVDYKGFDKDEATAALDAAFEDIERYNIKNGVAYYDAYLIADDDAETWSGKDEDEQEALIDDAEFSNESIATANIWRIAEYKDEESHSYHEIDTERDITLPKDMNIVALYRKKGIALESYGRDTDQTPLYIDKTGRIICAKVIRETAYPENYQHE